jgi:phospholipid/cholesterol/gamma-HCH transport system ATP-binding protein
VFLYKGRKLWEGDNKTIIHSNVEELDNFIFANKLMRDLKGGMK